MIIHKLDIILVGAMYLHWFFFQKLKYFNNVLSQEISLAPYERNQSFASMLNKTMVGLQLVNPKQWATSNFEQHLNGGSSIVKFVCLICIHSSSEHATILLTRKIYPKFKSGL
jgi:threonine/homoserine/homoserine lactone efflux protein